MPVPASLVAQVTALNTAVVAAGNLDQASFQTLNSLAYQAGELANATVAAIPVAAGALDTWTPPLMPGDIATGVLGLLDAARTQTALCDVEGFVARIEINLENR